MKSVRSMQIMISPLLTKVKLRMFGKQCPPVQPEGHHCKYGPQQISPHCLSYTAMLFIILPIESVPLVPTVRVLPSADTTIRPVVTTLLSRLGLETRL